MLVAYTLGIILGILFFDLVGHVYWWFFDLVFNMPAMIDGWLGHIWLTAFGLLITQTMRSS